MKGWNWHHATGALSGNRTSYSLASLPDKHSASALASSAVVENSADSKSTRRASSKFYVDLIEEDNSQAGDPMSPGTAEKCSVVKQSHPDKSGPFIDISAVDCRQTRLNIGKFPKAGPPVLKKPSKVGVNSGMEGEACQSTVFDDCGDNDVQLRPHVPLIDLTVRSTFLPTDDVAGKIESPDNDNSRSLNAMSTAAAFSGCSSPDVRIVPILNSATPANSKLPAMNVEKSVPSHLARDKLLQSSEQLPSSALRPVRSWNYLVHLFAVVCLSWWIVEKINSIPSLLIY